MPGGHGRRRDGSAGRRREDHGRDANARRKPARGDGAGRSGQGQRRGTSPRPAAQDRSAPRPHSPGDLRASNRPNQDRSPDIDKDVTGKELDRATLRQVQGLDERHAGWVAKHLVMAGRLMYEDPAVSFQHALAASRKGGRLACVREAVALTAYAAGEYAEALREFRTYRRMTGDTTHLAAQVDCERALGRVQKALQLAADVSPDELEREARAELAMVVSGIHEERGDLQAARTALEIPELDRRRGYPFSPRLFQRYADVLAASGEKQDAATWRRYVRVAEKALGLGGFADPDILDVDTGPSEEERTERRAARAAEQEQQDDAAASSEDSDAPA